MLKHKERSPGERPSVALKHCNLVTATKEHLKLFIIMYLEGSNEEIVLVEYFNKMCKRNTLTSIHTHQPFAYDTKYCWQHITKCFELNTVCKSFKILNQ
jgi:hypothetical protein